jgi:putative membrane protein
MPRQDEKRLSEQSQSVSTSARRIERSASAVESSTDRTTRLAADRTVLAAERTYAAWTRTALASLASGVGARTILAGVLPYWLEMMAASVLIAFSALCFLAGVWRELFIRLPPPEPNVRRIPTPLLLLVNGFLAAVSIAALVGVWLT